MNSETEENINKNDESETEYGKYLKTYKPGESFGELSLLYNAPRAATIISKSDSVLFALDRECFNHIVKDSAAKKREKYDEFLQKVDILSTVDPYERSQISDAFITEKFEEGEFVFQQGEEGERFYLVESGNLKAYKVINEGSDPIEVYDYKEGDYFGELSLLKSQPRQASIKAIVIIL